ncbi:MAG: hypothetical protein M1812_003582 [Candelaria pacifica]|nr:MAG: hypothetical protein M1812_003582 [Candelaria pacifica]
MQLPLVTVALVATAATTVVAYGRPYLPNSPTRTDFSPQYSAPGYLPWSNWSKQSYSYSFPKPTVEPSYSAKDEVPSVTEKVISAKPEKTTFPTAVSAKYTEFTDSKFKPFSVYDRSFDPKPTGSVAPFPFPFSVKPTGFTVNKSEGSAKCESTGFVKSGFKTETSAKSQPTSSAKSPSTTSAKSESPSSTKSPSKTSAKSESPSSTAPSKTFKNPFPTTWW